jgi:Zn finger protein HypA/HybF involved in hydrogenase expression
MHERHQVENLVRSRIAHIRPVMGKMPGFDETPVRLYFEHLTEGSSAGDAGSDVRRAGDELLCRRRDRNKSRLDCPACGRHGVPAQTGKEFYVENIVTG